MLTKSLLWFILANDKKIIFPLLFSFDAGLFIDDLKDNVAKRKRQSKEPKQIRYLLYLSWAVALRKKQVGPLDEGEEPKYRFPADVLAFLRSLVPQNIKGEIWPTAYKLSLQEFCDGLDIPKKNFLSERKF